MKYWMIEDGNSEGPFSLEELTARGLAAETKVWRQGLPQWTEARLVPELAQIFGVEVVEKHRAADDAVRHCPTHLRAAVVTTVIIALSFFNVFAPLSLLGSPFFYLLLPLSWLSIRSAVTARRMLRSGNIEAAMKTHRPHRASHHAQRSGRHHSFSVPRRGGDILVSKSFKLII